jgi:hypothetical protein
MLTQAGKRVPDMPPPPPQRREDSPPFPNQASIGETQKEGEKKGRERKRENSLETLTLSTTVGRIEFILRF